MQVKNIFLNFCWLVNGIKVSVCVRKFKVVDGNVFISIKFPRDGKKLSNFE